MKPRFWLLSLILPSLIMMSCGAGNSVSEANGGSKEGGQITSNSTREEGEVPEIIPCCREAQFPKGLQNKTLLNFSNEFLLDTFLLAVEAGLVEESHTTLHIISHKGDVLYADSFPTTDLINGYELYNPPMVPQDLKGDARTAYIMKYRNAILKEDYETYFRKKVEAFFEYCMISLEHKMFAGVDSVEIVNHAVWEEVLDRESKEVFRYGTNEENGRYVAYSKELKRAVVIYYCC